MDNQIKTDILIVGSGVSGLYSALHMPRNKKVLIITKKQAEESDSYLAQGGICVLRDDFDYDDFFEDTMKAGHYENLPESVEIMIRSSQDVIQDLISYGVDFEKNSEGYQYTREGAHSRARILFHKDETGKEITSKLLKEARRRDNITIIENFTMVDLICNHNICYGIIGYDLERNFYCIESDYTVLATGGVGGLFKHTTNYHHLSADAIALALKHNIELKNIDYIQIHPTTLYTQKQERSFLISESVRGEGAILLNSKGERFINELLPRDIVANAIYEEMKKENSEHVWLSMLPISEDEIYKHFPNIYQHCLSEGYDVMKEMIPVVPSQHYFMGGIAVNSNSKSSMDYLYAVGETACNGVHGRNRLASNSLLESLVFAKRCALDIRNTYHKRTKEYHVEINPSQYDGYEEVYKELVLSAIEKEKVK